MGCGNPKEKIEDEMLQMKMKRIEIQMERLNQLEQLKNLEGKNIKPSIIPEYIDENFLKARLLKEINSSLKLEDDFKQRRRSRKSKSFAIKRNNNKLFNINDETSDAKKVKRRKSYKRKTFKF